MERICIVTGATGGIGKTFVDRLNSMPGIDRIWAVGRNGSRLNELSSSFSKVAAIKADLDDGGVEVIQDKLQHEKPEVVFLINNAGLAFMGRFEDMDEKKAASICNVNCTVPALLMNTVLPYMQKGAHILNVSSASSFQPNPYLAMYSASKVFLKNLSRAVNYELKPRGITVTAVCPGWVDTGMLPREEDGKKINYLGMISPEKVVDKALKDSLKGKDMSTPSFFASYFRLYSKYMPASVVMRQWAKAVRRYI